MTTDSFHERMAQGTVVGTLARMPRRTRLSPQAADAIIALAFFGLALVSRVEINGSEIAGVFSRQPDVWNTLLIALQTLPLAVRRRYPLGVMATVVGAFAIDRIFDYPSNFATAGLILAIHAIGSELPPRRSLRVGGATVAAITAFTAAGAMTLASVGPEDVGFTFLATATPLALGREVFQRRRRVEELEERAERAEREREERAAKAVAEERARIARELHDVVAHQMTVMTLQAEGAGRISKNIDPRVADALDTIRAAGHDALAEMRRMVGLLRTQPDDPSLIPQPGVNRLDALAAQMGEAGLNVTLEREGTAPVLSSGVDLNLYRIVQESLTNTLKHGGPAVAASVTLRFEPNQIRLDIVDDGRGAASNINGDGGGHGLVGMRERVALLEGTFQAGPRAGGGFQVQVTIPVVS